MADYCKADSPQSLSFLSQNWLKAQKEVTELEIKLVNQTVQSLKAPLDDLASSFNREWENFMKSSLTMGASAVEEQPLPRISENWSPALTAGKAEDFVPWSLIASLLGGVANFEEASSWKPLPSKHEACWKASAKEAHMDPYHCKESVSSLSRKETMFPLGWKEINEAPQSRQMHLMRKKQCSLLEWEPLRRLRAILIELETTAAASKSPNDFFENVKKMEFFENTKNTLSISIMDSALEKDLQSDIFSTLDLPELLGSLVSRAEPLLDRLGIKRGFQENICAVLRSWKDGQYSDCHKNKSEDDVAILSREAATAANELDLRLATVLDSEVYKFQEEFWGGHALWKEIPKLGKRSITIVTTASLPWMTGTAINPLLRAAYLAKHGNQNVTLLIPWLSKKDQCLVYPNQMTFNCPQEQESYIRDWLHSRISFKPEFKLAFYPGKFSLSKRSILAVDDITAFIPSAESDIAILEEPEHLTWYHHGARWTRKFRFVVGIVHTNYLEYVKREKNGPFQAFLLKYINNWVTNVYCHKVIRLSAATQNLPKSIVCNVHGVSPKFLEIGQAVRNNRDSKEKAFTHGAYFLGKMVWGKGYQELLDLWALHKIELNGLQLDVFGNGEDSAAIEDDAANRALQITFHKGKDHADSELQGYKVFINPSISDVVSTTTAEALAMGKIVVCADHPSNDFFKVFPNCYMYRTSGEFAKKVKEAMSSEPLPLLIEQQHMLSWEAATERFLTASELDKILDNRNRKVKVSRGKQQYLRTSVSKMGDAVVYGLFLAHYWLSGIEIARLASGALPGTIHIDKEQQVELGLI